LQTIEKSTEIFRVGYAIRKRLKLVQQKRIWQQKKIEILPNTSQLKAATAETEKLKSARH